MVSILLHLFSMVVESDGSSMKHETRNYNSQHNYGNTEEPKLTTAEIESLYSDIGASLTTNRVTKLMKIDN